MPDVGTPAQPLRVAVVGAGPAGFYAAGHLFKQDLAVEVDLFDKLPTPHGLVRAGVAPDHQKIKSVTRVYDKIAAEPGFRFFGNVAYGTHLGLDDLRRHYHAVIFTTGAQVDRRLGLPGEDLDGSHSATDFVAWYNGHPEYRHLTFDLSREHVVIVGVGNVAVDVARILCRTPDELARTDIADYALDALRASRVRSVTMLGRRGPAQAAFTNPEVKELGELPGADIHVRPDEAEPDALSRTALDAAPDRTVEKKLDILKDFAEQPPAGKPKRLAIRFLVSPVEILDDGDGRVGGVRIVRNALYATDEGRLRPRATDTYETLPAGLVFRSIGYRGVALPELPFDEGWGVVPNAGGRVVEGEAPLAGLYVAGWIKRGPTGVIGTNKPDAVETVESLLEDVAAGRHLGPSAPEAEAAARTVRAAQPDVFTYEDWQRLDALETERGAAQDRPRVKFICTEDMLEALGRA